VTGVEPAGGSLDVAQAKPGANRVCWIHGNATTLPPMQVDLVTMTGNVAQAIVDLPDWEGTLRGAYDALRPGGHLVSETRHTACGRSGTARSLTASPRSRVSARSRAGWR
jgi:SAM-dependent methyltransferase